MMDFLIGASFSAIAVLAILSCLQIKIKARLLLAETRLDLAIYRLKRVKSDLSFTPIDDHDTCMCGSSIDSHNIGSGHSPVSMADYSMNMITEGIERTISEIEYAGK